MNTYIRHLRIDDLDEIFEHVIKHQDSRKARVELDGNSVGVTSLRLRTFAKARSGSFCCVTCSLQPKFFAVENGAYDPKGTKPHLNLYGYDAAGEEVLFTHDHVLARGLGGADHISNTQLMCLPCNGEKAKAEQLIVDQRRKQQ